MPNSQDQDLEVQLVIPAVVIHDDPSEATAPPSLQRQSDPSGSTSSSLSNNASLPQEPVHVCSNEHFAYHTSLTFGHSSQAPTAHDDVTRIASSPSPQPDLDDGIRDTIFRSRWLAVGAPLRANRVPDPPISVPLISPLLLACLVILPVVGDGK
ncbi:hypothetical protein PAPYR_6235 [Paratrimastix pyriformis]|uniref:Uncharacterized protein n=1 Tax=Paratrimastix pyriformis TaxID=342808 RepID=A0ABQ8UK81_9EUKA|nr:hypothetical protein PAPYR_6235 [Paratrimastix pyriformis]